MTAPSSTPRGERAGRPAIDWTDLCNTEPSDRTPTPSDCRKHEISDLYGQGAGPRALRTAHTINLGSYL